MNQNPDPSQHREPDPPGYAPDPPSYYGNFPAQPATTEYYHNLGMQYGQPGAAPGYPPPGAAIPPPLGFAPPPPYMNMGMPPAYPAPKKKRTWLWVLIGSAIVCFVLLITACGVFFSSIMQLARTPSSSSYSYSQQLRKDETQIASSDTTSNGNSTASSDTSSSDNNSLASTDTTASTVVNVGQKVSSNGVDCTVVSVQKIDGDGYARPEAGNQLIVVHVKLENHSAKSQAYNVFDFHSISNGQAHSEFIFTPQAYTANNRLHYGEMLPGATVEGDIFFQVPINDHQVKVSWEPLWVYSETQYEWNLGL